MLILQEKKKRWDMSKEAMMVGGLVGGLVGALAGTMVLKMADDAAARRRYTAQSDDAQFDDAQPRRAKTMP